MDTHVYTYDGDEVTVTWDRERWIHAEACVKGLPDVFAPERRPWIKPLCDGSHSEVGFEAG